MAYGPTHARTNPGVLVSNIATAVTVKLLWELFLQIGAVTRVHIFRDRGRAFIDFAPAPRVVLYACLALDGTALCGRALAVRPNDESADEALARRDDAELNICGTGTTPWDVLCVCHRVRPVSTMMASLLSTSLRLASPSCAEVCPTSMRASRWSCTTTTAMIWSRLRR